MYVLHHSVERVESVNSVDRTEMVLSRYLKHTGRLPNPKSSLSPPMQPQAIVS